IALAVLAAGRVGVRDLVDDRDLRLASEHGIDVHLLDRDTAVLDRTSRYGRDAFDERCRLRAAVRLDEADHHIDAALPQRVRLLEHSIGLADAGREAEVELQTPALGLLDDREEILGTLARRHHRQKRFGIMMLTASSDVT